MPKTDRRQFLKHSTAGLAGLGLLRWPSTARASAPPKPSAIPLHRGLEVPGVHAYTDQQSVAAGETISFHVSSTVPYRLSVCRLGLNVDDPSGDVILHEFPASRPRLQPIHPGSYLHVAKRLTAPLRSLSLECWLRPWKTDAAAGLLTQYDFNRTCGFGLFLNSGGAVGFYLGDGGDFQSDYLHAASAGPLKTGEWHHLVASWDGAEKAVWVNGEKAGVWPFRGVRGLVEPGAAPLRLAAAGKAGLADQFLDGDLSMPIIYRRALAPDQIGVRFRDRGAKPAREREVLACWTFTEERGTRVADSSPDRRHGQIINHGTWMIGGPSFDPDVPRFGHYDPRKDARRGHGLRFAADDLYDCRWEVTHQYRLPASARSGIYVGRIRYELGGQPYLYHATFIVRKAARRRRAPILLLTATNTWRAYSGTPFPAPQAKLKQVWGTGGIENSPGNPPAFNFYRAHAAGQGTYQLGLRMPWPAAGPYVLYGGPTDYSHLMRADRFAQVWLEQAGYDYNVITDLDLHRDPELLRDYRVFFINGHSEYWSIPMYRGLERFLGEDGNAICLSGNSLFWRVSFNRDGSLIECRKVDAPGDQMPPARRGECWHSHDGLRGGLMRECGYPGWKLIGLETLGWNNQSNPEQFGPYLVERAEHFLFQQPEPVGVENGAPLGQAPQGGLPRANGHEIDVRLSTLAALQEKPAPAGTSLPGDPPGMTRLANGIITWKKGGAAFDYFFRGVKPKTDQGGELIYWERPEGGRIFNAGSIGAGWALWADRKYQRLLANVLHHFGVKPR